jgi:hypothetical protein
MGDVPTKRRRLFMHPAHRSVGVSGDGLAPGPYCRMEGFAAPTDSRPLRIALLARRWNADTEAAATLFEKAVAARCDVECGRVDIASLDTDRDLLPEIDCLVAFGQTLCITQHWRDVDATARAADGPPTCSEGRPMEVEMAPAAEWHPVLEGVWPFPSRHGQPEPQPGLPEDAFLLLAGRADGQTWPVAWVRHTAEGPVFCTSLGSSDDFRQPDFVRLLLNALRWVSQ